MGRFIESAAIERAAIGAQEMRLSPSVTRRANSCVMPHVQCLSAMRRAEMSIGAVIIALSHHEAMWWWGEAQCHDRALRMFVTEPSVSSTMMCALTSFTRGVRGECRDRAVWLGSLEWSGVDGGCERRAPRVANMRNE